MRRVTRGQENVRIVLAEGAETSQGRRLLGWASDDEGCPWGQAERGWEVEVWPWGVGQGLRLERRHPACCPRRREGTTLRGAPEKIQQGNIFLVSVGQGKSWEGEKGSGGPLPRTIFQRQHHYQAASAMNTSALPLCPGSLRSILPINRRCFH